MLGIPIGKKTKAAKRLLIAWYRILIIRKRTIKMKKMATKVTVQAGKFIFTKVTAQKKEKGQVNKRGKKKNPTAEEVMQHNQRYAERDLSIKLHHNFGPKDLHIVLTYSGKEPTKEEAKKYIEKFKRQLANLYKKQGLELKWIEATEYKNKRIHHHFVVSYIGDVFKIADIWPHGYVRPTRLDDSGDYRKLAAYLIKETSKTFRDADAFSKRRYNCSRTVKAPDAREEVVSIQQVFEAKATKGYQVDQDTIYKGVNLATDRPYIEYIQVALEAEPRAYKRGRKIKYKKEKYIAFEEEEQQMLFDIE